MQDLVLNSESYYFYTFKIGKIYVADYNKAPRKTYEVYHIKENGYGEFSSKETSLILNPGQLLYVPPDATYKLTIHNAPNKICYGRSISFRFFPYVEPHTYIPQIITPNETLLSFFEQVPEDSKTIDCYFIFKTYQFLNEMQKYLKRSNEKYIKILQPALDYMNSHDRYDVPELANLCNISEAYFYALFKKVTGLSPVQMKQKIQSTKAEQLLKTTDLSIEEIAEKVGFSSVAHFRKVFRTRFEISPNKIRMQMKNQQL